jgi:pimeloyl-ACP methyl ester carboxylesterase
MIYLPDNGLAIHYELHGHGEPVLLLHGFGGTGRDDWKHQVQVLSQRFQLIVPDLRGHGRTDHPEVITGPEFFDAATADMVGLVSSLGLGPVHVCGFSMGASIAAWFCLEDPSLVRSLILVSGAARLNRDTAPKLFKFWEDLSEPDDIDPAWSKVLARVHGEEKWRTLLRNYGHAVLARVENDEDILRGRAAEMTCPTLIVQGTEDSISPRLLSEELHARIPDSELLMLQSDHWVPGLKPDEFNAAALGFLDQRFPPSAAS